MTPAVFVSTGVEVTRGGRRVLASVDLGVGEGLTVVAGPSGAGKSTLLRLFNRLEAPTAGSVTYRGDDLGSLDPLELRRRVAMVFQRPVVFPGTVRANLDVARPRDAAVVGQSLAAAALDETFLDRVGDELSVGEQQRVCMARALCTEPDVVLMDEPTSALDPRATAVIESSAMGLVAAGHPVIWVSHDLDQLGRLADRVVLVAAGRIVGDGTTDELAGLIESTLGTAP